MSRSQTAKNASRPRRPLAKGTARPQAQGKSRPRRPRPKEAAANAPVFSACIGDNSDLIPGVAQLYLTRGDTVADVTYGRGVFWRQVDTSKYDFHASDVLMGPKKYDFRNLPYGSETIDTVVLDPPYTHDPGTSRGAAANYNNAATTRGLDHDGIIDLYRDGMREAHRVLRPGGRLWIKCQEEVESGRLRSSQLELELVANQLGFLRQDCFVLVQSNKPLVQAMPQRHARRNHSYLLIFEKAAKDLGLRQLAVPRKPQKRARWRCSECNTRLCHHDRVNKTCSLTCARKRKTRLQRERRKSG